MKRIASLVVMIMMTFAVAYAQEPSQVEKNVDEIVKKYENVEGVECISVVKGGGLEMIKMMLNKELGKSFMKGVTSITIIDYSDASQETCMSLRQELDVFLSILEEFDVSEDKSFADSDYIRSFAITSETEETISDLIIAMENDDSKSIMYMAGKIKLE